MNNKGWRQGFVEGYGALSPPQKPTFASGGEVDKYMKELQARRAAMPAPGPLQDYITSLNNRTVPSYQNIAARGRTNPDGTPKPWAKPSDFPYTGPIGGGGGGGAGAGLGGAALGILAFLAKNPDVSNKLIDQIRGLFGEKFDPEKFATSDEAQAATDQAQAEADARELARGTDPNLPDSTFDTAAGAAAAGAAAGATTGTTPAQQADITPRDLVTDESLIDQRAAEQEQEQTQEQQQAETTQPQEQDFVEQMAREQSAAAAASGAASGTTPEQQVEITAKDPVTDENLLDQQTQAQPQPTATASSALPAAGAASAGLGALANTAGPTGQVLINGQLIGGAGAGAAASAVGSGVLGGALPFSPSPQMLDTALQAGRAGVDALGISQGLDLGAVNEGFNVTTAGRGVADTAPEATTGFNLGQMGLNMGAGLLGNKMWGQGNESRTMQNLGSGAGGMLGSAALASQLGMFAGPVGILAGSLVGSLLDAGSNPDPLKNPITGRMVEWNDPEYATVKDWYIRNENVPQAINSYDYSTEDQARLQSMFDMASTDPGAFDPKAVEDVAYNATGLKFDPMSFEEFAAKTGYTGSMDPANFAMYNPEMKGGATATQSTQTDPGLYIPNEIPPAINYSSATTAQPAATQSSAVAAAPRQPNSMYGGPSIDTSAMEQQMAAYDPYAYLNEYYSDNMYGFAGGGEIPDAGGSDLGPHEYSAGGKFLRGGGDGMSDDIVANIDGTQEARLADGEFVIPADVVSHLGNGSSEAGSRVLYAMMDRVRKARTGSTKQGKQIDPDDHVPA